MALCVGMAHLAQDGGEDREVRDSRGRTQKQRQSETVKKNAKMKATDDAMAVKMSELRAHNNLLRADNDRLSERLCDTNLNYAKGFKDGAAAARSAANRAP